MTLVILTLCMLNTLTKILGIIALSIKTLIMHNNTLSTTTFVINCATLHNEILHDDILHDDILHDDILHSSRVIRVMALSKATFKSFCTQNNYKNCKSVQTNAQLIDVT
jgi:hypothetical protein